MISQPQIPCPLGMQNVHKSLPFLPKGSDGLSNVNEGHDYERVR
jgi:hypothetical protein